MAKETAYYIVTYYVKNTNEQTKDFMVNVPHRSLEYEMTQSRILKLVCATLKRFPHYLYATVMEKGFYDDSDYYLRMTVKNRFCADVSEECNHKLFEIEKDDVENQVNMHDYEVEHKGFEVNLEKEEKVVRLGPFYYDLKGLLICEASEAEKKKYECGKYMTYPIVDDAWKIYEGIDISEGIDEITVGKKGDTMLLKWLQNTIDYYGQKNYSRIQDILDDLERHGITVSNRKNLFSKEELPNIVVLHIEDLGDNHFNMKCDTDCYYIPERYFRVGDDDELYEYEREDLSEYCCRKIVDVIADDVLGLSWFFNRPNLRVLVTGMAFDKHYHSKFFDIPKDWYYTVQTLESDINRKIEEEHKRYPNSYNEDKRPDLFIKKD